jgi:hypothetical protein
MTIQEMIQEALNHKHEPWGAESILVPLNAESYSLVMTNCKCGVTLTRETAPQGAKYNWEDWKVMA